MIPTPAFVCDLANNHFGDMEHAKKVIASIAKVQLDTGAKLIIKFQFRDLDTYIHKDFRDRRDLKYIDRFLSTRLNEEHFFELTQYAKELSLLTMATPFDENGADWITRLDIDIAKIASASANDYPLLEYVKTLNKPVVASTGGLRMDEVDRLVFTFKDLSKEFVLMHCVSIYPCPSDKLNMNQITNFKNRFNGLRVGFSTHENQDDYLPVALATSLGASLFERHVGISTDKYQLNSYSSSPKQLEMWVNAQQMALSVLGNLDRSPSTLEETETLKTLKRGVYAKIEIKAGAPINKEDVYFAFPVSDENQVISGGVEFPVASKSHFKQDSAILWNGIEDSSETETDIPSLILQAKSMFSQSGIKFNENAEIELSHHFGIQRFREFGALIVTCYNNEYAKKLILQYPRQKHPYHHHKLKKESFQLLWGDMELVVDGISIQLELGQIYTVERGSWHKFSSLHGAIVEEISTSAISSDSYYEDPKISKLAREKRKTQITL